MKRRCEGQPITLQFGSAMASNSILLLDRLQIVIRVGRFRYFAIARHYLTPVLDSQSHGVTQPRVTYFVLHSSQDERRATPIK